MKNPRIMLSEPIRSALSKFDYENLIVPFFFPVECKDLWKCAMYLHLNIYKYMYNCTYIVYMLQSRNSGNDSRTYILHATIATT